MSHFKTVISSQEALEIARDYAFGNGVNETRAEAYAEVWFDAGKDEDKSRPEDLRSHLDMKFNRV